VIQVQPMDPSATPSLLSDLFSFHGAVSRAAIRGEVGFVEFQSAASTASALLFDRTKLAGKIVAVTVVEEAIPEEVWITTEDEQGEELFEELDHEDTAVAAAGPGHEVARFHPEDAALPSPAPLPPPMRTTPATCEAVDVRGAGVSRVVSSSSDAPAASACAAAAEARRTVLTHLASEPINSPTVVLGITVVFQLGLLLHTLA